MKNLFLPFVSIAVLLVSGVNGFTLPLAGSKSQLKSDPLAKQNVLKSPSLFPLNQKVPSNARLHARFIAPEIWTSFLPTCLGFWKSEYTVSYGYGFGTALSALSILRRAGSVNALVPLHAAVLMFYGFRLNLFLFVRTLLSKRMQDFQDNIEERAQAKGNRWTTRAPFILSCSCLYYGLVAPLLLISKLTKDVAVPMWATNLIRTLIGVQWFGFGIAAIGDLTKTYVKQSEKNERFLVTSGIFSIVRHPNYTGEIIGWTANNWCGVVAACFLLQNQVTPVIVANVATMTLGWVGILMVLLGATGNLEKRQKKDYGDDPKYTEWVKSSWSGWRLPAQEEPAEEPHLEVSDESEEFGSGI